jgi:hypothetical protein
VKFLGQDGIWIGSIIPIYGEGIFPAWTAQQRREFALYVWAHGQPAPLVVEDTFALVDGYQRLACYLAMGTIDNIDVAVYKYESDEERDNHALALNTKPCLEVAS